MVLLAAIIAVSQAVVIPGAGVVAAPAYGAYPGLHAGLGYPAVAKVCFGIGFEFGIWTEIKNYVCINMLQVAAPLGIAKVAAPVDEYDPNPQYSYSYDINVSFIFLYFHNVIWLQLTHSIFPYLGCFDWWLEKVIFNAQFTSIWIETHEFHLKTLLCSQQESRSGDVVQGSYSLVEPDGEYWIKMNVAT